MVTEVAVPYMVTEVTVPYMVTEVTVTDTLKNNDLSCHSITLQYDI